MRGGQREGAGRPCKNPETKRVQHVCWVAPETKEKIRILKERDNITIGRELDKLVASLFKKSQKKKLEHLRDVELVKYLQEREKNEGK